MAVASPLGVTASGPLDSLGTRQYTVQPLYDLRFINPIDFSWNPPAGAIDWYFIPGDAVGPKPDGSGAIAIGACHYQQVCEYAPPGPGRMEVTAYVETSYAVARSANACDPPSDWEGVDEVEENAPADNCGSLTRRCPKFLGKVITAGIAVAGTMHTFKFEGPFTRIDNFSVPGTYPIRPTVSEDGWWIAESGTITVDCYGFYIRINSRKTLFVGHASYRRGDLHMVMGPGNPDFHNTQPD